VEIIFQAHHAVISAHMRQRAERVMNKIAKRLHETATDAVVRFERDSGDCRVELQLNAPRHRPFVAEGRGRFYGPALAVAAARLEKQLPTKDTPKTRTRERARMIGRA
jgi:ribosome-associated translation inhibitor RaiA